MLSFRVVLLVFLANTHNDGKQCHFHVSQSVFSMTCRSIENAKMYTRYAGSGRTVFEHRVVTSYLDRLTLPTKRSVHLYALQIR